MLNESQKRTNRLVGRFHVQRARDAVGLVRDEPDRRAVEPSETDHDVPGVVHLDFRKFVLIDNLRDEFGDMIRLGGRVRYDVVHLRYKSFSVVACLCVAQVAVWQKVQQALDLCKARGLARRAEMRDASQGGMRSPSPSAVTLPPVTADTTCRPVMNILPVFATRK
jgi:hypothetical protein